MSIDQEELILRQSRIVFPKPLSALKEIEIDETSFSPSEKVALQNAWRIIRRRFRYHAAVIFLDFYTANEILLENFHRNGKFNLNSLHQHPQALLRIFGRLTEEGLEVPTMIYVILTEVVLQHRKYHVSIEAVQLLTHAVRNYLQSVLKAHSSPTFEVALDKLCQLIINYHNDSHASKMVSIGNSDENSISVLI